MPWATEEAFEIGGKVYGLRVTDAEFARQVRAQLPVAAQAVDTDVYDVMVSVIYGGGVQGGIHPFHFVYRNWKRVARSSTAQDAVTAVHALFEVLR